MVARSYKYTHLWLYGVALIYRLVFEPRGHRTRRDVVHLRRMGGTSPPWAFSSQQVRQIATSVVRGGHLGAMKHVAASVRSCYGSATSKRGGTALWLASGSVSLIMVPGLAWPLLCRRPVPSQNEATFDGGIQPDSERPDREGSVAINDLRFLCKQMVLEFARSRTPNPACPPRHVSSRALPCDPRMESVPCVLVSRGTHCDVKGNNGSLTHAMVGSTVATSSCTPHNVSRSIFTQCR